MKPQLRSGDVVFAVFAIAYLVLCTSKEWMNELPKTVTVTLKALPIWILLGSLLYYSEINGLEDDTDSGGVNKKRHYKLTCFGLLFGSIGDVLLALDKSDDKDDEGGVFFLCGLVSFLLAHIFYAVGLYNKQRPFRWPVLALFAVFACSYFAVLFKNLDNIMLAPVAMYTITIAAMAVLADGSNNMWARVGAVSFVASDSCLAWNMFASEFWQASFVIMATYYTAQFLLMRSAVYQNKQASGDYSEPILCAN
ncbi:MAG: hypothetical protein MHM6MM_002360 [Cercozoa sp. M6MM]